MAIVTRVEPISDWINITVDEALSPAARSRAVATFAKERLEDAKEGNRRVLGRIPPFETFVDGQKGVQLERVNPDHGRIVVEFELMSEMMVWVGQRLRDLSPVHSGRYRDAHTLFADGAEVPIGAVVPAADVYLFINPLPYARRIEIGKTEAGRDFVVQVPNRIYERTAAEARRRWGNLARIDFGFQAVVGGGLMKYGGAPSKHRKRNGVWSGGVEWQNRVPAITVRVN